MFDIGWSELMLIGVVALVVIGPKELPKAIYGVGKWVRKARLMAREFQSHVDDMMREAELNDLRDQAMKARDKYMAGRTVEDFLDPKGEIKSALDLPPASEIGSPKPAGPNIEAPATPPETANAAGVPQTGASQTGASQTGASQTGGVPADPPAAASAASTSVVEPAPAPSPPPPATPEKNG